MPFPPKYTKFWYKLAAIYNLWLVEIFVTCNNTVAVEQKDNRLQDNQFKKVHKMKQFPSLEILASVKSHLIVGSRWKPMSTIYMHGMSPRFTAYDNSSFPHIFVLKLFTDNGFISSKQATKQSRSHINGKGLKCSQ